MRRADSSPATSSVARPSNDGGGRSFYERLFGSLLFPAYERWVKGQPTGRMLAEYERNQWLPREALRALAAEKLAALVAFAWREVPHLERKWRAAGVEAPEDVTLESLTALPLADKDEIRDNYQDSIAESFRGKTMSKATGGSTGVPFRFEFTAESDARRNAVMWRGYRWAGADLGRRTLFLWGTGADPGTAAGLKERLYHRVYNRRMLNSFELSTENVGDYLAEIDAWRPQVLVGYVTPLYEVAQWILARRAGAGRHERTAGDPGIARPRSLVTGAEPLFEFQRETIEAAFGAPVFNTYGCREFMLVASECEARQGLHVNADHLVVETVDDDGRPVRGEPGHVVVTDLHNYGMPFVRYRNGDMATLGERVCECGRSLPIMESVDGRRLDAIKTRSGRRLPGEFFPHMFKDYAEVRQFQVVQESLDELVVKLVTDAPEPQALAERLAAMVREALHGEIAVRMELAEDIPLTESGKRRVTISHV